MGVDDEIDMSLKSLNLKKQFKKILIYLTVFNFYRWWARF